MKCVDIYTEMDALFAYMPTKKKIERFVNFCSKANFLWSQCLLFTLFFFLPTVDVLVDLQKARSVALHSFVKWLNMQLLSVATPPPHMSWLGAFLLWFHCCKREKSMVLESWYSIYIYNPFPNYQNDCKWTTWELT